MSKLRKMKTSAGRKGQEQFTMRNELLENELVKNSSDDGSIKKGKFNSTTLLLNKKTHEHPMSVFVVRRFRTPWDGSKVQVKH